MRRGKKNNSFHIDIAPVNLIDLLLILLVFFITTTSFLQLKIIKLNIPHAVSNTEIGNMHPKHIVNINEKCELFFNKNMITKDDLPSIIDEKTIEDKRAEFHIAADKNIPYYCFIDILDIFTIKRIENLSLLTQKKDN